MLLQDTQVLCVRQIFTCAKASLANLEWSVWSCQSSMDLLPQKNSFLVICASVEGDYLVCIITEKQSNV